MYKYILIVSYFVIVLAVPLQRSIPTLNEGNFIEPLQTNYVLSSQNLLPHVMCSKSVMEPLHCSHYIVGPGPGPIDYASATAASLGPWDTSQVPTANVTNDPSNGKQVRKYKKMCIILNVIEM